MSISKASAKWEGGFKDGKGAMKPSHVVEVPFTAGTYMRTWTSDVNAYYVSIGMKQKKAVSSPAGRPRAFDANAALDQAMRVFWRKGYEGASLADLTEAMGINRPSLYAAFGDKEALFKKALDRYDDGPAAYAREALKAPTARSFVEQLLEGAARVVTNRRSPGCLLVQGGLATGDEASEIRKALSARRTSGEAAIRTRLEQAKKARELPASVDTSNLARYVVTVIRGMAVQATDGATRDELRSVIEMTMRAWPGT